MDRCYQLIQPVFVEYLLSAQLELPFSTFSGFPYPESSRVDGSGIRATNNRGCSKHAPQIHLLP